MHAARTRRSEPGTSTTTLTIFSANCGGNIRMRVSSCADFARAAGLRCAWRREAVVRLWAASVSVAFSRLRRTFDTSPRQFGDLGRSGHPALSWPEHFAPPRSSLRRSLAGHCLRSGRGQRKMRDVDFLLFLLAPYQFRRAAQSRRRISPAQNSHNDRCGERGRIARQICRRRARRRTAHRRKDRAGPEPLGHAARFSRDRRDRRCIRGKMTRILAPGFMRLLRRLSLNGRDGLRFGSRLACRARLSGRARDHRRRRLRDRLGNLHRDRSGTIG